MPSREERLAANEARFREINESAQPQREAQGTGRFVCECADRSCSTLVEVSPAEYALVRTNPRHFLVVPGHELPDLEQIVETHDGYYVIEKPPELDHIVDP